jgi:hypothetical protein
MLKVGTLEVGTLEVGTLEVGPVKVGFVPNRCTAILVTADPGPASSDDSERGFNYQIPACPGRDPKDHRITQCLQLWTEMCSIL